MQPGDELQNAITLIRYRGLARVRRELENILVLIDELQERGVSRDQINRIIENITEDEKADSKDECPGKEQQG